MASAKRLMELRHDCFSRCRIAEISVPAWPIPIHHTKFTMANPHATGMFTPQIPIPRISSQAIASSSANDPRNVRPKVASHSIGVLGVKTSEDIFSVTQWLLGDGSSDGGV